LIREGYEDKNVKTYLSDVAIKQLKLNGCNQETRLEELTIQALNPKPKEIRYNRKRGQIRF